jgi:hypothetical protein
MSREELFVKSTGQVCSEIFAVQCDNMRENYSCNVIQGAASGAVLIVKVFIPSPHFSREELSFLEAFIGVRSFVQKQL